MAGVTKVCSKCGETKAGESFTAGRNSCKECNSRRVRQWKLDHRDKVNAQERARRSAMDDSRQAHERELSRQRSASNRAKNPERARESNRRSRGAHRDAASTRRKAYYEANAEREREQARMYHANNAESLNARHQAWRKQNPTAAAKSNRQLQQDSLEGATRRYFEWAGWELELVSDPNRTARSLAAQLGRTYASILIMRHSIRHDPQTIERVGLSESGSEHRRDTC